MNLLPLTSEERKEILKQYNITETQIKVNVEIIKEWKEKLPYLPTTITGLTLNLCLPLPKLTPKLERVILLKLKDTNPDIYDVEEYIHFNLAMTELSLQFDDSIGIRYMFDFEGFSFKHLLKFNPIPIAKHFEFIQKTYSCRISGVDCINLFPAFAGKLQALLRQMLWGKLQERLKIYSDINALYNLIPKECLPSEYGGSCSNIPDLLRQWDEAFKNHKKFFIENYNNIALEHLRPEDMKTNDEFGPDGTFKKLTVD
ncbi:clavesin-1-like isoform X2 [Zophobas morio]|uniref:clavesin-1-like isoform X2 n=1 Tax=Zophobas morio TaxID=2755281 RepID=UPI003082B50D